MIGKPQTNENSIKALVKGGLKTRFIKGQKVPEKIKKMWKGRVPWNKGKSVHLSPKTEFKKGLIPWNKGLGNISDVNRIRRSLEYKEWRKEILKERNYTCQECNERGKILHIHHLEMICIAPERIMDKNNVIVVCKKCHYKIHKYELPVNQHLIKKYRGLKSPDH